MRHYPYEYPLWYNLEQAMKCDIYLKLLSYAKNCLICTLHPLYCEKKLSIRYGAHKPVRVSCSHCHVVDVMNDIILCSYAGFVLNVCLLNRCGKCTYMAINSFWIWIWISNLNRQVAIPKMYNSRCNRLRTYIYRIESSTNLLCDACQLVFTNQWLRMHQSPMGRKLSYLRVWIDLF